MAPRFLHLLPMALASFLQAEALPAPEDAEAPLDESWESLLAETDSLLAWSDSLLAEPESFLPATFSWSASLAAGPGYSDNFLKRASPEGSRFWKIEGDAFLMRMGPVHSLTALLFFEGIRYQHPAETDSEATVFLHANWTRSTANGNLGLDFEAFYGDQIFDASLAPTLDPEGDRFRQLRPELFLFTEYAFSRKDVLRLQTGIRRAVFEESVEDYWSLAAGSSWQRQWGPSLKTESLIQLSQEWYDEDRSRDAGGLTLLPEERLEILILRLEQSLTWEPRNRSWSRTVLRLGADWESDRQGAYDDSTRSWASLTQRFDFKHLDLSASARWQDVAFDHRMVDFSDSRPLQQRFRSLRLEAELPLPWRTYLKGRVQWADFDSRREAESFSEKRADLVFGASF